MGRVDKNLFLETASIYNTIILSNNEFGFSNFFLKLIKVSFLVTFICTVPFCFLSNVISTSGLGCESLKMLITPKSKTNKLENIKSMFYNCPSLLNIDLSFLKQKMWRICHVCFKDVQI